MSHLLVLGTHNRKKRGELQALLAPHGFDLRILDDFLQPLEVEESGDTFAANARLKAVEQARHLGAWVLGEDSGLAVDALEGAPGVHSARFSGPAATDASNNALLLAKLNGAPWEDRGAQYVCHAVLADPAGNVRAEAVDICRGCIRFSASGSGGFGYDPLFEVREYHRTFGELGPQLKGAISHRGRAIRKLIPQLAALAAAGAWEAARPA